MNAAHGHGRTISGALCLALLVALTGCPEFDAGLDVGRDGTGSGQLLPTARNSVPPQTRTPEQGFADLRQYVPALPVGEESRYGDVKYVGTQISYDRVPLRDFSTESVKLIREDDRCIVTLDLDLSANGTGTDRPVTWKLLLHQQESALRAVAQTPPLLSTAAGGSTGAFPWLLVVAGVAVLLVAGVAVLLVAAVVVVLLPPVPVRSGGRVAPPTAVPQEPKGDR